MEFCTKKKMKKGLLKLACLFIYLLSNFNAKAQIINMQKVGNYATGVFDQGATEIAAFDPATNHLFSVNDRITENVLFGILISSFSFLSKFLPSVIIV